MIPQQQLPIHREHVVPHNRPRDRLAKHLKKEVFSYHSPSTSFLLEGYCNLQINHELNLY